MVWNRISPRTGKKIYIKRYGDNVILSYNQNDALDSIPEGWDVVSHYKTGEPKLQRKR